MNAVNEQPNCVNSSTAHPLERRIAGRVLPLRKKRKRPRQPNLRVLAVKLYWMREGRWPA